MKRGFPILAITTALLLSFALYEALIAAPTEQTMGNVQRIFYYHVPSAWTAFLLFFVNFLAFVQYLVRRAKVPAQQIAPWGVIRIVIAACIAGFVAPLPLETTAGPWPPTPVDTLACYFLYGRYISRVA